MSPMMETFFVNLSHRWSSEVLLLPVAFVGAMIVANRSKAGPRALSNPNLLRRSEVAAKFSALLFGVSLLLLVASVLHIGCASVTARETMCLSNLRQVSTGMLLYAEDYDQRFPPSERWSEAISDKGAKGETYLPSATHDLFKCPSAVSPGSYGMNAATGGISLEQFNAPISTAMLFEADAPTRSFSGGLSNVARTRHQGASNLAFADGHAKRANESILSQSLWSPSDSPKSSGAP